MCETRSQYVSIVPAGTGISFLHHFPALRTGLLSSGFFGTDFHQPPVQSIAPLELTRMGVCRTICQRAAAGWLFFRVARSLRIDLDMLVARALKNSQLTCGDVIIICETVH
jgi:hypothetical protein